MKLKMGKLILTILMICTCIFPSCGIAVKAADQGVIVDDQRIILHIQRRSVQMGQLAGSMMSKIR